jgi:hypothetical protein
MCAGAALLPGPSPQVQGVDNACWILPLLQQDQAVSKHKGVKTKVTTCNKRIEQKKRDAEKNSAVINDYKIRIQVSGVHR